MEKFERFSEERLTSLRARYRGDDLFRTWTWILCLLEQQLNGLNAVEVWSETEMIRQKLSAIKEHRDNEVEFLYGDLVKRHQSESTAIIILTVLFTQMCDAAPDEEDDAAERNPNRAVCMVLARRLKNKPFFVKLIAAYKSRRYDNEGNKIILPVTDYLNVKSPLELMDEEAKVKVERWVEEIEKLTRGIRGFLNIDWDVYKNIWRNICAEQEISLLLKKEQPRNNKWGHNLKLVANVLGILHVTPYGDGFVLAGSIQTISDAVGVNVRAYIGNHADFGSSNTTLTKEMHAKIKQFMLSAIG
ncbi:hypothetical protein NND09_13085 [Prevotella copri]|uniref:Uncharacterized protein n=1 Tax=Segatella copri TaxID=165179 RepID=A0AAW4YN35_9BACT|nr:hypothetical protein [Segatella copri]MCE4123188.1 hypothetical protein [Segatella copri]MCP9499470.1 hypothetical protein [Segatella copri]MCP9514322.1 hypothetical protein [Segatella copri]MCP9523499.1 hypothetical protein [Segatella copri]